MSDFLETMNELFVPCLLDIQGTAALYTPEGGSDREVTILVSSRKTQELQERNQQFRRVLLTTYITKGTGGISGTPKVNDRLVYDGISWRFHNLLQEDVTGCQVEWASHQDVRTRGN